MPDRYVPHSGPFHAAPYPEDRDAQLLCAIAERSDRAAFSELFVRYAPRLLAYFVRRVRERARAEDLVQDVMLRVWASARSYRGELSSPSTWIFRIARHRRIDVLRRTSHELLHSYGTPDDELIHVTEQELGEAHLHAHVQRALALLSPDHAEVVRASYFAYESAAQTSLRLGIPLGTVKSRMAHALARLRGAIGTSPDVRSIRVAK